MIYRGFKLRVFFCLIIYLLVLPTFAPGESKSAVVTNSFFETDIREVLRDISAQTGVKIVADETVQGSISIELKGVPLEKALRMVLSIGNYTFRQMPEGYYLVGLCTPNSPSFNRLSITEYFRPSYLKAKELKSLVSEFYQPYIQINEDVNTVTITASPEIVSRLKEDLIKFDQPPRQVMIEALVIELSEEGKKSLGVTWGSMLEGGFSVYPPSTFDYTRNTAGKGTWQQSGTLSTDLLLRINSLVSEGKAKVRANPRVATLEGKQAEIYVGKEEYYLINVGGTAQAYYTLQSIATGVVLKITPYIDKEKQITVTISPQVSEVVGKGATNLPVITKRTATTSLRVNDGQTIAIGGLVQEQSSETISKTPILGSIPLLGLLFRHKTSSTENKEVVIFITPRLLGKEASLRQSRDKNTPESEIESKESSFEEKDPITQYYDRIKSIIDSQQKFPNLLRELKINEAKEVVVEFIVFSDGVIDEVRVVKASGIPPLDFITSKLIKELSPLPPFPEQIKQPSITFAVTLRYEP